MDVLVRYEAAITTKVLDSAELLQQADSGRVSDIGRILDLLTLIAGLDRQIQLLGGNETSGLAKVFDLLARVRTALLRTCKEAPVDPLLILGLERMVQLLGVAAAVDFSEIAECAGLTNQPTPRAGVRRITGQVTMDYTDPLRGDHARAIFEFAIVEDETGLLVFGPGSRGKVDWTLAEPWEGCPASASSSATIGSMNNQVLSPMSEPNPDTTGLVLLHDADLLLKLSIPGFQKGTGIGGVTCDFPRTDLGCGYSPFMGKLVHDNPYEWSFACSSQDGGGFWSTEGRLIATW